MMSPLSTISIWLSFDVVLDPHRLSAGTPWCRELVQWLWRHELQANWSPIESRPSRAGLLNAAPSTARLATLSVVSERVQPTQIRFTQVGFQAGRHQIQIFQCINLDRTYLGCNRMLKNPGVVEIESATFGFLSLANASIAIFIVKMYHLLFPQMICLCGCLTVKN